jgi:hypothetical protein
MEQRVQMFNENCHQGAFVAVRYARCTWCTRNIHRPVRATRSHSIKCPANKIVSTLFC